MIKISTTHTLSDRFVR